MQICRKAFGQWLKFEDDSLSNYCDWNIFLGHPGLDLDVGEFLDSLQLNNLKDIFEKEQASRMKGLENTVFQSFAEISACEKWTTRSCWW